MVRFCIACERTKKESGGGGWRWRTKEKSLRLRLELELRKETSPLLTSKNKNLSRIGRIPIDQNDCRQFSGRDGANVLHAAVTST